MNLDEVFQTFLAESREMLEEMERYLLEIEAGAQDSEQLNALFRCVHTIKGSAGLFALDHVVAFTHVVENVLDRLREGEFALDHDLAALLLQSRDHIASLIDCDADRVSPGLIATGEILLLALADYQEAQVPALVVHDRPVASDRSGLGGDWHISLRFGLDVLRQGMDPMGFIRYLGTLGEITRVVTLTDALPAIEEMDAESCYLGFEIDLRAETDQAAIEAVFEFVQEDCQLRILPPGSGVPSPAEPEVDPMAGDSTAGIAAFDQPLMAGAALGAASARQPGREVRGQATQYIRVQADKLDA
ncbi:MAG TPA: chemotaxis protein CheA, partial [Pseudomonas sp.]|nr:chemotaxis protein CheA [Pseudomonas sp.]